VSRIPRILPLVAIALVGVAAVRLIGAGPGLFQGAQAWAEGVAEEAAEAEGETAAPETPPPPVACAIPVEELARQAGLSPAELRILQNLSARRGELDLRDVDFETQLPLLISAEAKAQERIDELTGLRTEIQGLLGQVSEREQEETNRLVQVYQAMRPRDAAPVFSRLSDDVRLPVAAAMRPRALAAILAEMEPEAARILTQRLASRYGSQDLAARAADDEGTAASSPPQTPAQTPAQTPTRQPAAGGQPAAQPPARTPPQRPRPRPTPPARAQADAPAEPAGVGGETDPQSQPPAQPRVSVQ
jgi:flagellar motility protein MotE (MotC chaperone)